MREPCRNDGKGYCLDCGDQITPASLGKERNRLKAEVKRLKAANAEWEQSFDLYHKADIRGIQMWREAHSGNELVMPDKAKLVAWLLEQWDALRKERDEAKELEAIIQRHEENAASIRTAIDRDETAHAAERRRYQEQAEALRKRVEALEAERGKLHALLQGASAAIDPEEYGALTADIFRAIGGCEAGCVDLTAVQEQARQEGRDESVKRIEELEARAGRCEQDLQAAHLDSMRDIDQARREGAEEMRERAASKIEKSYSHNGEELRHRDWDCRGCEAEEHAAEIRALPIDPPKTPETDLTEGMDSAEHLTARWAGNDAEAARWMRAYREGVGDAFDALGQPRDERMMLLVRAESAAIDVWVKGEKG